MGVMVAMSVVTAHRVGNGCACQGIDHYSVLGMCFGPPGLGVAGLDEPPELVRTQVNGRVERVSDQSGDRCLASTRWPRQHDQ